MELKRRKIFVGLSGGVDSAVSAALLKESGADVTGVFIKGWYPPGLPCTWAQDRRDAMRVAAHLRIPFMTLDASAEYKKSVIEYLVREYGEGRTPNPDVMCNREVKFGAFYRFAREHGADFIATGHYARSVSGGELLRGLDSGKDQSYFLWAVPLSVLEHVIFPLGELHKTEVRRFARRYRLPNAEKRDSQGICFLGPVSIEDFLRSEIGLTEGVAKDDKGIEVGKHVGAIAYTLGERAALTTGEAGPWYVFAKNLDTNELVVSHNPLAPREKGKETIMLRDANWFLKTEPEHILAAQYRYHGPEIQGALSSGKDSFVPTTPQLEKMASGQSLVLYDGDAVVGGGIIV